MLEGGCSYLCTPLSVTTVLWYHRGGDLPLSVAFFCQPAYVRVILSVIFRRGKITVFLLRCGFSTSVMPDGRAFCWFDFCLETIDIRFKILIIIKFCSFRMSKLDICHRIQVFSKQVTLSGFNSQSGILVYAGQEWVLTSVAGSSRCWLFLVCIMYLLFSSLVFLFIPTLNNLFSVASMVFALCIVHEQ